MNRLKEKEMTICLYTDQLSSILQPIMFVGFQSLFDKAFEINHKQGLEEFCAFLKAIPSWSDSMLKNEVNRIKYESQMADYLDQLFNIVITTIIMLMTMTPSAKQKFIKCPSNITINKFVHMAYIQSAEKIFMNCNLFVKTNDEILNQKNINEIKSIINKSIDTALTNIIPLKYILDNYVGDKNDVITEQLQTIQKKSAEHVLEHVTCTQSTNNNDESVIKHSSNPIFNNKETEPKETEPKETEPKKSETKKSETKKNNDIQKHKTFSLSKMALPEDSPAYHNNITLDLFSNNEYSRVVSVKNQNSINKINIYPKTTVESSVQNYVQDKRIKNTKV